MTSTPVHATVVLVNANSAPGVLPFGAVADQPDSSDPTLVYVAGLLNHPPAIGSYQPDIVLHADTMNGSTISASGNFGALVLPGSSGSNDIRQELITPSSAWVTVGMNLGTETGNMQGPVQQGSTGRFDHNNGNFTHTFTSYDEWFFGRSTDAAGHPFDSYTVTLPDGTTHTAYKDPQKQNKTDAHLGIIPLITNPDKNGSGTITVLGFGVFFIDDSPGGGSHTITSGHFVGIQVQASGIWDTGGGGAGGGAYVLRLVQ